MKITKLERPSVCFDQIGTDEVCQYEGDIYMAVDEIRLYGDMTINAINLETARLVYINYSAEVIPLPEAELVY